MKKRILALLLIMAMMLGICACGNKNEAPSVTGTPTPTEAPSTPTPTPEPTATPTPTPEPVDYDGIFGAYSEYLSSYIDEHLELFSTMRYSIGFVNDDDIPELFFADDSYHACGVHVATCIDGQVVEVGEFGEFGSFAYIERKGLIYSFYMGMGVMDNILYDFDGKTCTQIVAFESNDETGKFTMDEKEITEAEYEAALDKYHAMGESSYCGIDNGMIPYEHTLLQIPENMKGILDAHAKGEVFYTFMTDEMKSMVGNWVLYQADYYTEDGYVRNGTDIVNGSFSLEENGLSSFWVSMYDTEQLITNYGQPIYFYDYGIYDGAPNQDWSVSIAKDTDYYRYYATLNGPDELELCIYYEEDGNVRDIVAEFHRDLNPEGPEGGIDFDFTPLSGEVFLSDAKSDNPDLIGFNLEAYEWVTLDTPDLIAKYDLPEDLDGYDYEIMRNKEGDRQFWVSKTQTSFALLDYDLGVLTKEVSFDEFMNDLKKRERIFCSITLKNDSSNLAVSVIEEYCG